MQRKRGVCLLGALNDKSGERQSEEEGEQMLPLISIFHFDRLDKYEIFPCVDDDDGD